MKRFLSVVFFAIFFAYFVGAEELNLYTESITIDNPTLDGLPFWNSSAANSFICAQKGYPTSQLLQEKMPKKDTHCWTSRLLGGSMYSAPSAMFELKQSESCGNGSDATIISKVSCFRPR